jgi:ABC-type nitrate/sulfonate/bicarbonate transport system permease component
MYGLLIIPAFVAAVINTLTELLERRLLRWQP